jgi:hypothetical protein
MFSHQLPLCFRDPFRDAARAPGETLRSTLKRRLTKVAPCAVHCPASGLLRVGAMARRAGAPVFVPAPGWSLV